MVQDDSEDHHSPGVCDVCAATAAALRCEACHLDLCVACSRSRHRSSLHLTTGRFRFYGPEPDADQSGYESPATASAPSSPAAQELRRSSTSDALWGFDDALAQSLRALTFAPDEDKNVETERRPRSFSDYAERWRAQGELSEVGELWDAMRTDL
ncbi:Zinc ion binding protein, partial [Phytophthora palmivora]